MTMRQDLYIRQGETWSYVHTHLSGGSPVDLTGYSARMAIKRDVQASAEAYLSTGADANGGSIALGDEAGTITLSMTAAQSAALGGSMLNWHWMDEAGLTGERKTQGHDKELRFIYDLEIVSGAGAVTRVLEGRVIVSREVTS